MDIHRDHRLTEQVRHELATPHTWTEGALIATAIFSEFLGTRVDPRKYASGEKYYFCYWSTTNGDIRLPISKAMFDVLIIPEIKQWVFARKNPQLDLGEPEDQ